LDYLGVATTSIHLCGRWVWWWCCESKVKEASSKMEGLRFVGYNFILLNSVARWQETIVRTLPVTTPRVDAEADGDGVDFLLRCWWAPPNTTPFNMMRRRNIQETALVWL
jgi:hypothetical protein